MLNLPIFFLHNAQVILDLEGQEIITALQSNYTG